MRLKNSLQNIKILVPVVFVFVAVIGFGTAYAIANASSDKAQTSASCPVENCIRLLGKTADPDTITVITGSYVQFNSADGGKHNIALEHAAVQHEDSSEYESGDFEKDEAWKVQFKKDGAYTFRDIYNPGLKINVVAYTEGKDYKIE